MRRSLNFIATLAFVAMTCSLYVPTAHGQGFLDDLLDLANEVDDLINNNSNNSNNQSSSPNSSSNASTPLAAGDALVPANSDLTEVLPTNSTVDGPMAGRKRWSLPVAFHVDVNGNVTVMPRSDFPTGNRVRIVNDSPNEFFYGYTRWSGTPPATAPTRPSGPSSNPPSVGTGHVTVLNRSSNTITARYNLPSGQLYGPNNYTWMYQPIAPGGRDRTTNIAAGTKVTVDGYNGQEFFVRKGDELTLVVDDNGIGQQAVGGNPGRRSPGTGTLPNQVAVVPAGTTWKSDNFPAGTRAVVGGSGVTSQTTYKLPATVTVFADGGQAELSFVMSGTYLDLRNNSSDDVIVECLLPSTSPSPPRSPAPAAAPTGNIHVLNSSGKSITARYELPAGKTYFYGGANHNSLYAKLDDEEKDETLNIAVGTKVTVDGYKEVFSVRANDDLYLTVLDNAIVQDAAVGSPGPAPNPSPPRLSDSDGDDSPAPPAPSPMPTPSAIGDAGGIPKPTPTPMPPTNDQPASGANGTKPLSSAVAGALTQRINAEVNRILAEFDLASKTRAETLQGDLGSWEFIAEDTAAQMGSAAMKGDSERVSQLFDAAAQKANADVTEAAVTLYEPLKAVATFRAALSGLSTKISAGHATGELTADFKAIRQLAEEHESSGLVDAMTMIQRDLVVRDQINRAVPPANANQPLPSGSVTMIRHPLVANRGTYLGTGGLILTKATDANITVVQATAGATTKIDKTHTFERPSLASLQQAAGTTLFNFEGPQPAPAGPTGASDLLDLLKAAQ